MIDRRTTPAVLAGAVGIVAGVSGVLVGSALLGAVAGLSAVLVAAIAVKAAGDTRDVEQRVGALEDIAAGLRRSFDEERREVEELHRFSQAQRTPSDPSAPPISPRLAMTGPDDSSIVDGDSGLRSTVYFHAALSDRVAAARRHLRPVSVVICELAPATEAGRPLDSDDTAVISRCLQRTLRDSDLACRLEGSRFGLLLEDTADTSAVWAIERLRRQIQMELPLRVRAGIASYPTHGLDGGEVLSHAETALRRAATDPGHDGIQVAPALD